MDKTHFDEKGYQVWVQKCKKRVASRVARDLVYPAMTQQLKDSCLGCRVNHGSQHHHGCLGFLAGGVWNISEIFENMQALENQPKFFQVVKEALGGMFYNEELTAFSEQWLFDPDFLNLVSDCLWQKHLNNSVVIRGRDHPYLE